jgi:hypothetical protein
MGAAMSVALIDSTWPVYLKTQAPGILLGFVTAAVALPTRHALQVVELPALVVLLITVLLSAGAVGTLLVVFPRVAGNHGILALRLLVSALATKLPARGRARITSLVGGLTRQQETRGSDAAAKRMLD